MGKEQTVESSEQSTHALQGKQVPTKSVSRTLLDLTEKAKRDRKYRFRSLYREIDLNMLYDSFHRLRVNLRVKCTSNLRVKVHHFEDVKHHQNGSPTINQIAQEQRVE